MLVFEFKAYAKSSQLAAVNEAIRTAQFVRNSCLRYWMDNPNINKYDLNKFGWRNPAKASWFVDRRIPVRSRRECQIKQIRTSN